MTGSNVNRFSLLVPAIVILSLLLGVTPTTTSPANASGLSWIDHFSSAPLDARWVWENEDSDHWSLTAVPGKLRIVTQTGGIYATYYSTAKNILLTDAPTGNFVITTKVDFNPSANHHTAGILYYQNADNYLNLVYLFSGNKFVSFHHEVNGTASFTGYPQIVNTPSIYLRITRVGTHFSGFFSTDNVTWYSVGSYTTSLTSPKVGLYATNSYDGIAEIPADFDFFEVVVLPYSTYLPLVRR